MFSPVPMMRLRAIVLARDQHSLFWDLGRLGVLHLSREPAGDDSAPLPPSDRTRAIARCEHLRARVNELQQILGIHSPAHAFPRSDLAFDRAESLLAELEHKVLELVNRREEGLRRAKELRALNARIVNWSGLDIPLVEISRCEFLHVVTGTLPEDSMEPLGQTLGASATLLAFPLRDGRYPLLAITTKSRGALLADVLQRAGFVAQGLPPAEDLTADQCLARTQQELTQASADLEQIHRELESIAAQSGCILNELDAWLEVERRLMNAEQTLPRTEATVLLSGWVPQPLAQKAQQVLLQSTRGRCVVELRPPDDVAEEDIPVLLQAPRLLRPFQMLVTAYGLPKYRELAPTLFVATSFVLMFGMMFGDVGHGGLLGLAGLVLRLKSRASTLRDCGLLLLFNGLASAGFGVMYGSYFGIPSLKRHALWQDPLEGNPTALMELAIGVGIVLMSLGLLSHIVNCFRHRGWIDGVVGKFGAMGVLFYWGAIVLLTQSDAIRSHGWWPLATGVFLGLPTLCWILKGPVELLLRPRSGRKSENDGLVPAVAESLVGSFEGVLLYLANTVSFIRLAAYAMSHAALLMATFTLAAEVGRLPAVGPALGILVIALGNLVTIFLEGIVASVQALRLVYYEFFGKFFSGEGKPYQPFCLAAQPD